MSDQLNDVRSFLDGVVRVARAATWGGAVGLAGSFLANGEPLVMAPLAVMLAYETMRRIDPQ